MQKNKDAIDFDFIFLVLVSIVIGFCLYRSAHAKEVRTLRLNQQTIGQIKVTPGKTTILSFPSKPSKVVLGGQGMFAVEYIENDIAIAALRGNAHSNIFVYLDGRRFAFDLSTAPSNGDEVVFIRDQIDAQMKVRKK